METPTQSAVLDALRRRRSIGKVRPERPAREQIEQIIEAATWAPNHYRTAPWRFIVLAGGEREALGDLLARRLAEKLNDEGPEAQALIERERKKPLRAPVVIAVASVPSEAPRVREIEEIAAVAAGVENMLLAAQALGLGAMWRTGEPAYDPEVRAFLGLPDSAHILSFIYVGYPDMPPAPEHWVDPAVLTQWRGWD